MNGILSTRSRFNDTSTRCATVVSRSGKIGGINFWEPALKLLTFEEQEKAEGGAVITGGGGRNEGVKAGIFVRTLDRAWRCGFVGVCALLDTTHYVIPQHCNR